ncbi:hypothetical protein [Novosphingobium resinovorum]|uniref:hypothetical protein n=1 Tax=Novosphingobium resinovorum TaxID=158500 RepID=UPI002ED16906|nr:hypothetical protein [Novosphingobium resinovorum]
MSTNRERLHVIYDAYSDAYDRRLDDWSEATSKAQAKAISDNLDALETLYLRAAKAALDASGQAVEDAMAAALEAQEKIDNAYEQARGIAEKVRLVGEVVSKIGDLVTKASGG